MTYDGRLDGFTVVEVLLAVSLAAVLAGMALPLFGDVLDRTRTAGAARYLAARIAGGRIDAIRRSASVGLRFQSAPSGYMFRSYVDGNANGIRGTDIQRGIDQPLTQDERLSDTFAEVRFELATDIPDLDGVRDGRLDGVRIGAARILALAPDGTATSGTLYLRGRRSQFAVRVLGGTGRTRVFEYLSGERKWISR